MNVYLATNYCSGDYGAWFPEAKVINHEKDVPNDVSLLILSGGGDISPKRYGEKPTHSYGIDLLRDEREFNIIRQVLTTNDNVKILGICRGAQLLNAFVGGDLYQDLGSIGKAHPGVHTLLHVAKNPLDWLTYSNSLHHQAIHHIDGGANILAIEPVTDIPEIVSWRDWGLGVQFHPEMFHPDMGDKFFSVIENWVNGLVSFNPSIQDFDFSIGITGGDNE
jgi:gamma-glutamyl-gamma-aminobutyrate hydrolase PuuD